MYTHYPLLSPSHSHWTPFLQQVAHLLVCVRARVCLCVCACVNRIGGCSWSVAVNQWWHCWRRRLPLPGNCHPSWRDSISRALSPLVMGLLRDLMSCGYYGGNHSDCTFVRAMVVSYPGDSVLQHTSSLPRSYILLVPSSMMFLEPWRGW